MIVNDGSPDSIEDIVMSYAKGKYWIDYIPMPERMERNFAAKVHVFNIGCEMVKNLPYDIIGNIDADISFDNDFFEYLLGKFDEMPELIILKGTFHSFRDSYINVHHVKGQCQLFRRQCFVDIGGYIPIRVVGLTGLP